MLRHKAALKPAGRNLLTLIEALVGAVQEGSKLLAQTLKHSCERPGRRGCSAEHAEQLCKHLDVVLATVL